jgi:uncharacterized protein
MSADVQELLAGYHDAMLRFDARALSDLYAHDAVHEFGFFTPGHPRRYEGRAQILDGYSRAWATPSVALDEIKQTATHATAAGSLVNEWHAAGSRLDNQARIEIAGVLVMSASHGLLVHVRDYMDVLGLAAQTGRLTALADSLASGPFA